MILPTLNRRLQVSNPRLIERAVVVKEDNRGTIRASAAVPGSTLPDGVLLGGCLSRRVEEAISEARVRLAGMGQAKITHLGDVLRCWPC